MKVLKIVYYIFLNCLIYVCIYFALFKDVQGAKNIFKFYAWFQFILSIIYLFYQHQNPTIYLNRIANAIINSLFDIPIILTLAYKGWFFYATIYLVSFLFMEGVYQMAAKNKPKKIVETEIKKPVKTKLNKFFFIQKT